MMLFCRKKDTDVNEREKMARLEKAEGDLRELKARADRAIQALDARDRRNHWREALEQMIQGVP